VTDPVILIRVFLKCFTSYKHILKLDFPVACFSKYGQSGIKNGKFAGND